MRTCQRVSTLFRRVPTAFITRLSVAEAAAKIFVVVEIPVLEEVVSLATKRNLYDCTDCTDCTDCIRASFLEAATAQSLKYVNGMEREKSKEKHESRTILENVENERKFQIILFKRKSHAKSERAFLRKRTEMGNLTQFLPLASCHRFCQGI